MDKKQLYCAGGCYKELKKMYCTCKKQKLTAGDVLTLEQVPKLTIKNLPF